MPASTLEPTARFRRSRTRSRTINPRPALVVSTLKPHQYDLRPSCASLVCTDCKTWVPITGMQARRQKLVPHDTGAAGKAPAVRCKGSNRLVTVDVTVKKWQERLEEGVTEADSCRSARQFYKPLPAPAKPVTRMTPTLMTADDALTAYRGHLKTCRSSSVAGRCDGTHRCAEGVRLAAQYEQLKRTKPLRDKALSAASREQTRFNRRSTQRAARTNAAAWAAQREATTDPTALTKRAGTAVEERNNTCRNLPGTVSEFRGPHVPTEPLRLPA